MKKTVFSLMLNVLIFSFVFTVFPGIKLPTDILYLTLVYLVLSVGIILQKPLLKFLTVKNNLLTYWLSASIICLGLFYLMLTFVPGLEVVQSSISQIKYGAVTVAPIQLNIMSTLILSVLLASLISGIMEGLKKPVEE